MGSDMTKTVRIENADTSNNPIRVQVWDVRFKEDGATRDDYLAETRDLMNPTDLLTINIWGTRYLVIKELYGS